MNHSGLGNKQYNHSKKAVNIYGENIKTKSSMIDKFCYHPLSKILEIIFINKQTYVFFDVAPEVYTEFAVAKSTGKAFHSLIKQKYRHLKIDG